MNPYKKVSLQSIQKFYFYLNFFNIKSHTHSTYTGMIPGKRKQLNKTHII